MKRAAAIAALVILGARIDVPIRVPLPTAVRAPLQTEAGTAADRGRVVYSRYGCAMCHSVDGKGGFANPNAETDGKVPGVILAAEGYTRRELRELILKGVPRIGREDPNGPLPPYRMPGGRNVMTVEEVN